MDNLNFKGSSIFLNNLEKELKNKSNLQPYKILIPSKNYKLPRKRIKVVARFDGITHYKFTLISLYNFIKIRKMSFLPLINFRFNRFNRFNFSSRSLNYLLNKYLSRFEISLYKEANLIVYQSLFSLQIHQFILNLKPKKNIIIYNGVPINKKISNKNKIRKYLNLVITAHFRLGKRLKKAILICNKLNEFMPSYLHIVGEIDMLTNESIKNLDLSNCKFYGFLKTEEILKIYSEMNIGLAPSVNEACSNSVLEMMSVGLPVLVSSAGGNKELMPNFDYVVNEEINEISYLEYHNILNEFDNRINNWVERILYLKDDLEAHSELFFNHTKQKFDIKLIADKYAKAINEI